MKKVIWLIPLFVSTFAFAGTQEGKVTQLEVRATDGLHYFYLSGAATGRPSCAQNQSYWMIADESSVAGQSQYALLLAAYMSGETVTVSGTNACNRWNDGEDVKTIILK
ncbi:hypothetical protein NBRC116583_07040 [Arenicella sp. 4NH20-0111]|uniref:hypothetical protein n=1 Tax=Arenicella sp. 4NH20-0111 TaxID=3127648 RepID=UPI0031089614